MRRRDFLARVSAGAAGLCLPALRAAAGVPKPSSSRPNILIFITDQQHAGMLGCAGNRWLKTPHLDGLSARGVRFERAYCSNPVCTPSRFSMLTGRLPSAIGMEKNGDAGKPVDQSILDDALGWVFRRAGYQTVYGGKVHLPGPAGVKGRIESYGFDYISPADLEGRDGLVEDCARFLDRPHDKPFLLVASFINPHDICFMALNAYTRSIDKRITPGSHQKCLEDALALPAGVPEERFWTDLCPPLPANHGITADEPEGMTSLDPFRAYVRVNWTEKEWRLHRWAYARLTESVDAQIGRVLDALTRSGLEQETLIVLVSDHGDMDGAHRLEHKSMPFEEAMHVPLILSGKGIRRAGAVERTHLVSTGLDLLPTLCDYAGIRPPATLRGRSVRGLVDGATVSDWRRNLVIENENSRVLHMGHTKYAVYDRSILGSSSWISTPIPASCAISPSSTAIEIG
jgi:choline-sulfatase